MFDSSVFGAARANLLNAHIEKHARNKRIESKQAIK